MSDQVLKSQKAEDVATLYRELCSSYRSIDDFRAKLLALLPIGTGLFLVVPALIKDSPKDGGPTLDLVQLLSPPIGLFGFVIALGLFFYELYGIRKCTHIIEVGKSLERQLFVGGGQFAHRAPGIGGFISEPFAAGIVYPAVMAAWSFLGLRVASLNAEYWAILIFIVFVAASCRYIRWLNIDRARLEAKLKTEQSMIASNYETPEYMGRSDSAAAPHLQR